MPTTSSALPDQTIQLPSGAHVVRNVAYGPDSNQVFDVYIPRDARDAPVLFMVHGGGWRSGSKSSRGVVQNKINYFLPRGYIFVSADYRLINQSAVTVMTEVDDVARVLAYAQQHAKEWGGDSSSFVLMGHSAGAHLVTLLSSVPSIWKKAGAMPWLGTVALDGAAYNVVQIMKRRHYRLYDLAFGTDPRFWEEVSPTLRLNAAPPPVLLVCSSLRADSCGAARAYAEKANSFGGRSKVEVMPTPLTHGEINAQLGEASSYTEAVAHFIRSLR
jgi:acetyl esterase/lipase